jgi:hypothetical protein
MTQGDEMSKYTLPNGGNPRDGGGTSDEERLLWEQASEAGIGVIPKAWYRATLIEGGPAESPVKRTKSYKLVFEITADGPYRGRRLYWDLYMTPAAVCATKAQLRPIGITEYDHTQRVLDRQYECEIRVVVERDDDQTERNRIREYKVLKVVEAQPWEVDAGGDGK